jgi:glycosyltransferase involved in cell wall biosynthesis
MPDRVTIDARMLSAGIGTCVFNILASLKGRSCGLTIRALTFPNNVERLRPLCDEVCVVRAPIYSFREQFEIATAVRSADLLHVPHYNAPLLHRGKLLVTIHDLTHIVDPTFKRTLASLVYARTMLNLVARKADHIVTDSQFTRNQIVGLLNVSPAKITVIQLGVSLHFCPRDRQEAFVRASAVTGLKHSYVLFVGSLKPHKNLRTLIRAFAMLWAGRRIDHQLLILGDDRNWKGELLRECQKLGVAEVVHFVPQVSYEALPWVYAAADLFVLPSVVEGFGLPILEAMACGTPVICSRAASLPEVAGDAAEYFEPTSAEDLADVMEKVLGSPERQAERRGRGLERAKAFSWDTCARQHREIYRSILDS